MLKFLGKKENISTRGCGHRYSLAKTKKYFKDIEELLVKIFRILFQKKQPDKINFSKVFGRSYCKNEIPDKKSRNLKKIKKLGKLTVKMLCVFQEYLKGLIFHWFLRNST